MIEATSKRIDMLIHELNHSGVSNAAVTLANAMVENDISTRLIVVGEKIEIPFTINDKIELKFLGIKRSKSFIGKVLYIVRSYFVLSVYLAKERSRSVFAWGKEFTILAVLFRITLPLKFKLVGVNVISISAHLHNKNYVISKFLNWVYKNLLNKSEHIIAQSSGMVEELQVVYDIPINNITVVYPPLQLKFFSPHTQTAKTNKILFIGRLVDQKDPFAALEIFKKLDNNRATLEFVGDGELEIILKEKSIELGLEERVSFVGRQNDIMPFLREADVLILPSKYEGFGMVLAESIACGVPVIAFDCPTGPAEIIIDGVNGYLIPQGKIDLFAKKLNQALAKDWDHKEIAETANKFHPDVVVKRYLEVIKQYLV